LSTGNDRGVEGFIAALAEHGVTAVSQGPAVIFDLTPVSGRLAGNVVPTGVSVSELTPWPDAPPHWIHFPETVIIEPTNPDQNECLPGWRRHSRDLKGWATSDDPGAAWLAHVRGVLADAR